jgi:hypothetical protein
MIGKEGIGEMTEIWYQLGHVGSHKLKVSVCPSISYLSVCVFLLSAKLGPTSPCRPVNETYAVPSKFSQQIYGTQVSIV